MMFRLIQSASGRRPSRLGALFARFGKTTAVIGCLTMTSGSASAAALLTFYETEDGVQAILTGSLDLPDSNIGTQTVGTENSARVKAGWELVYNWGTSDSLTKYEISNFPGDWTPVSSLTAYNSYDTAGGDGDPFQLYGRDGDRTRFLALDPNYVSGSELNATITWDNQDLQNQYSKSGFEALDVTSGTSFAYTLTGTDASNTFTVVFSADSPPSSASVPAPATPLLIAAGLIGGGLSRRLRRTFA